MASLLMGEHVRVGDRVGWLGDLECQAAPVVSVERDADGTRWIKRQDAAPMRVGRFERVVVY